MSYKRSILIGGSLVLIVFLISGLTFYMSLGRCPDGTFSCDNGTVCVPQRQVCDSRNDCLDGQDEDPIECGLFYGSKELIQRIMIKYISYSNESNDSLSIGKDDTENKDHCDLHTYPKSCACYFSTKLYCGAIGLTRIPKLSSQVSHLLVIGNNITLRKDSLKGLNPVLLYLKNNNISDIPSGIFSGLHRLERLSLAQNRLYKLPLGIFKGLESLQWLFLDSNNLHKFPLIVLRDLTNVYWMNLSRNNLSFKNEIFPRIDSLIELTLDYNVVEDISEDLFSQLVSLRLLSLTYNRVVYVHPRAFSRLRKLQDLRLSGNPLKQLSGETFVGMEHLDALFLDKTRLNIDGDLLAAINVSYLNLDGIEFHRIDFRAIQDIDKLKYIVYNKFYFCSMTPNVKRCKPNNDGISSFEDLLMKPVLRYSTWLMATLTFLGNTLVLWGRFIYRDENRAVTMVIRNLAVSDILMGFYLFTIGIQDVRYRNRYHEVALDWLTSWNCAAIGVVAVTSSEVSMLILAFMSLERFLLIADPFGGHRRLNSKNVCVCLFTIWMIGGIIAITPVILWRSSTRFYGTYSGTCFPLHIQERYPLGWEYSAFLFLGLNLFLLLMMALLYTALLISIWRTRRATPLAMLDCDFAVRFFFIVLTDVSCWAPIIFMKVWAFLSYDISDDTYAWLVVFILPLNSAVNPLLYTFTTPKYRNQILLRGWHKFTSRRKTEGSANSNPDESQGKIIPLLYQTATVNNWKI